MAKPNYSMAKRQRDLAKKAKAEEKRLRKAQALANGEPEPEGDDLGEAVGEEQTEGLENAAPAEEEP